MDCRIMKKEALTVLRRTKTFKYEDAAAQVPQSWAEHFSIGGGKVICGMYGINLDESMGGNEFEYLIVDNYDPAKEIPDDFTTRTIPAHTRAVFPCTGRMPQALQGLNQQIFSQWLPTNPDYKIVVSINMELHSDVSRFEDGTQDQDYHCEVWVPVEKKQGTFPDKINGPTALLQTEFTKYISITRRQRALYVTCCVRRDARDIGGKCK